MLLRVLLLFCVITNLVFPSVYGQNKKLLTVERTSIRPKIDGLLNDPIWENAEKGSNFTMYVPNNGEAIGDNFATTVQIAYDDWGIYVAFNMKDPNPNAILKQLTPRDNLGGNADYALFTINPFNDGLNDFTFAVTSAGVQADMRALSDGTDDRGWNAVWTSAVKITNEGWVAEFEIPYRCLRFSEQGPEKWGFNATRYIRTTRYEYTWNFIDRNNDNTRIQSGEITGLKDIEAPLRLSFQPYVSANSSISDGESIHSANAGMDLKLGINESFTLDMTLVPDFSQVAFDEQRLNISAVENRFEENRQFFIEGTELFNIGDIFYSRRIGGTPKNITQFSLDDENFTNATQDYTRMINGTKISGRTKENIGVGFLNAITANNYLTAEDVTSGEKVRYLIEPLTNYNMLVVDKRWKQNASLSLANTNVLRNGGSRDANVTALQTELRNKSNTYRFFGVGRMSNINQGDSLDTGFQSEASFEKMSGKFRFEVEQLITTANFDMNDMGFNARTNQFNHSLEVSYQNIQPFGAFNRMRGSSKVVYNRLYEPSSFESFHLELDWFAVSRNFFAMGYFAEIRPASHNDYVDTRSDFQYYFARPNSFWQEAWISSDYRKIFALDLKVGHWLWEEFDAGGVYAEIEPRVRVSDKLSMIWTTNIGDRTNVGYAKSQGDSIIFGLRNLPEVTHRLQLSYVFTPTMSLAITARHNWNAVDYTSYYVLNDDGSVTEEELIPDDQDINFNSWNLDFRYSWWFAPGSELVFLYRNSSLQLDNFAQGDYQSNLSHTFDGSLLHNLSLRIVYFIDYNSLKKK